ncbi:helix-turn-helix domain-containing protein [Nocardia sp. NPDC057272]|uniref:helix-turn-helix domain-containing protein n=1 Tax=Nocardia sp. NPDC057272 TaxID=3346079 RepID=UPI003640DCD3
MTSIGGNMYARRTALKLSRAAVARALDTNETQVKRWETTTSPPSDRLVDIAKALDMSVGQLLGIMPIGLDMSGKWNAVWQTSRRRQPIVNTHELEATHAGEFVNFRATGDYGWNSDQQLYGTSLAGTYRAVELDRNEHGALYFVLSHTGDAAIGRWSGQWTDGILGGGYGVLARDPVRAELLLEWLMRHNGPITEFPEV